MLYEISDITLVCQDSKKNDIGNLVVRKWAFNILKHTTLPIVSLKSMISSILRRRRRGRRKDEMQGSCAESKCTV